MGAGAIDEYRLLVHPHIAGRGKRFYRDGMDAKKLSLAESRSIGKGVLLLRFRAG
jgi:hypothetical protein